MKDIHKAITSASLPQYINSHAFSVRTLAAIHKENTEIVRNQKNDGFQFVDNSEMIADSLEYFVTNKKTMENEFFYDLCKVIGKSDAQIFCEVISKDWYLGKGHSNDFRVEKLKASISIYLSSLYDSTSGLELLVKNPTLSTNIEPLLSAQQIFEILTLNDQMMFRYIEEWKSNHCNSYSISTDDIFLRRGLSLDGEINTSDGYKEWDYINSYSLSFSAPEKFTQIKNGNIRVIINGDLELFSNRMLFFSPFIPGMDVKQLEIGIIPCKTLLPIYYQGNHAGILEYIINPTPCQHNLEKF
jgi:hypothetical protein